MGLDYAEIDDADLKALEPRHGGFAVVIDLEASKSVFDEDLAALEPDDGVFVRPSADATKHLAGQHDQQSHAHGGGEGLGSNVDKSDAARLQRWGSASDEFREFDSTGQLREMQQRHYGKWAEGLADTERSAVMYYHENGYLHMNHLLRGTMADTDDKAKVTRHIEGMDSALKDTTVPYNMVVYRAGRLPENIEVGSTFVDKGYVSTSLSSTIAGGMVAPQRGKHLIRIKVPQGTRGAVIDAVHSKEEYELVLNRGLRYKVTGIKRETLRISTHRGAEDVDVNVVDVVVLK